MTSREYELNNYALCYMYKTWQTGVDSANYVVWMSEFYIILDLCVHLELCWFMLHWPEDNGLGKDYKLFLNLAYSAYKTNQLMK